MTRAFFSFCLAATLTLGAAQARAQTAPLGYVTAVLIGQQDNAGILPAFNLVPGTNTANLDVALPLAVLTRGQAYVVMVMSQVGAYTGTCKTFYNLTQIQGSTKVVLSKGNISPYACAAGNVFGWALNTKVIGGNAGPATLTGQMTLGTQQINLSIPVVLQ